MLFIYNIYINFLYISFFIEIHIFYIFSNTIKCCFFFYFRLIINSVIWLTISFTFYLSSLLNLSNNLFCLINNLFFLNNFFLFNIYIKYRIKTKCLYMKNYYIFILICFCSIYGYYHLVVVLFLFLLIRLLI